MSADKPLSLPIFPLGLFICIPWILQPLGLPGILSPSASASLKSDVKPLAMSLYLITSFANVCDTWFAETAAGFALRASKGVIDWL